MFDEEINSNMHVTSESEDLSLRSSAAVFCYVLWLVIQPR